MRGRDDETGMDWLVVFHQLCDTFSVTVYEKYVELTSRTPLSSLEMAWDITPVAVKSKSKGFGRFPDPFVEAYLVV